jgi:lysophospholipase L1-like esterase
MKQIHKFFIHFFLFLPLFIFGQEGDLLLTIKPNELHRVESILPLLKQMKTDSLEPFSIVHLGDSHIQADFFGSKMRKLMQAEYGHAGRGFVFPYKLAKTNGHSDTRFYGSLQNWQCARITKADSPNYIGIPGYQLALLEPNAELFSFTYLADTSVQNERFSEIEILYEGTSEFWLFSNEAYFVSSSEKKDLPGNLKSKTYRVSAPALSFQLTVSNAEQFVFHGIVLSNRQGGVQYHSIGVNGATVKNYNQSASLVSQLNALTPKLIIVSLGTNESVSNIDSIGFSNQLAQLVQTIQTEINCGIIFTTPADNYIRKKVRRKKKTYVRYINNAKSKQIRDWIIAFCEHEGIAYWDMYDALGGKGSMKELVATGHAAKDHIHFSKKGYYLQATLFFEAIKNGVNSWEK